MDSGRAYAMLTTSALVLLLLVLGPAAGNDQDVLRRNSLEFGATRDSPAFSRGDAWCPAVCPGCPACPSAPPCPQRIPPGYKMYEGLGYYKIHYEHKNWDDAKSACEQEGGYLAVINSVKEAELTVNFVVQYDIDMYMHIGFYDVNKNGTFITVLDEPLASTGYHEWAQGEPNNIGKEVCGAIKPNKGLNDGTCSDKRPFLCELFA